MSMVGLRAADEGVEAVGEYVYGSKQTIKAQMKSLLLFQVFLKI